MSTSPWIAGIIALFVWWFSTGAILWVVKSADRSGRDAHLLSGIFGLPFLIAGIWGVSQSLHADSVGAVYGAFFSALAIWGWIELAFLAGLITGPNRRPCPPGVPESERFVRAWGTIAFHELLLVAALLALVYVSLGAANQFAVWTFGLLFFARISAKLNLFYGVPKINIEFLPSTLSHLPSHFRVGPQSWLFPISVTGLTFAAGCWLERLHAADTAAVAVGFSLLAAMTLLALLEHWLMVLPLPDEKLWRWMLPAPKSNETFSTRGKTNGL